MPALNESQIRQLRSSLDARESELSLQVRMVNDELFDTSSRAPHNQVEDEGEQGEQRIRDAVRYAEKERDIEELREIAAARERMDRGLYGECEDCGTDIPFARLQAQPFTVRCIKCQESFERSHPVGVRIAPMV